MNRFEGQFLLPQIYACIMWLEGLISLLEELISVVSVPLLSFGVSMTMIDFFVAGELSKNPQFTLSWSIIQAVSIDAQIAYTWHKARRAWHQKKFLPFLGFLVVGLTLAFVVWGASSLEGLDHATGAGTLASFGLTPQVLVGIRMAVAVILLCIAGWTRRLIAELDDISIESRSAQIEKPVSIFVLFAHWLQNIFLAIWHAVTFKNFREKRAHVEHTMPVQEVGESIVQITEELPIVSQAKITQKLPSLEEVMQAKESVPVNIKSRSRSSVKLSKNYYTKREVARLAKCDLSDVDQALAKGVLSTAKNNDEKVLKSSLEKFLGDRSKRANFTVVS